MKLNLFESKTIFKGLVFFAVSLVVVIGVFISKGFPNNLEKTTEIKPEELRLVQLTWLTYKNTLYGYQIKYPESWAVDDTRLEGVIFWSRKDFADFILPGSGGVKSGVYGVTVNVNRVSSIVTLKNYTARKILLDDAESVISTTPLVVGGKEAIQDHLKNTGTFSNLIITYIEKGDLIYSILIDYSSAFDQYSAISEYNKILENFRFTE